MRNSHRHGLLTVILIAGVMLSFVQPVDAQTGNAAIVSTFTLPDVPLSLAQTTALPNYPIADDRGFLLGGIGSDLWRAPSDPTGEYWMVTDRGPNGQIKVDDKNRRTFPVPDFDPEILHVKTDSSTIEILETIAVVGQSGNPVTGISNQDGHDEKPFDYTAQTELEHNPNGLDTEGIVRTSDGDFWLVDEYSPSILHVDATGKVVVRYVPEGLGLTGTDYPVREVLPATIAKRKSNRGFEGIGLGNDGKTLYLALQSPLSNPDKDIGEASRNTRILVFDTASEKAVAEYAYIFDAAAEFDPEPDIVQDDMKLSGVVALDDKTLLILERTDRSQTL